MSPFDWTQVKEGDAFTVRQDWFPRGGMTGYVVAGRRGEGIADIDADGVTLDFFCDVHGDPRGLPSIERWEWAELQIEDAPNV